FSRRKGETTGGISGLKNEDVEYLMERVSKLDIAAPIVQINGQPVRNEDKEVKNPRIFASNQYFSDLNRIELIEGRTLSAEDVKNRANVAVVGEEIRDKLFADKHAVGKFISFDGITLEVVGVFKRLDMMGDSNARDV